MKSWNFWDTVAVDTSTKTWRKCLGTANNCLKKIKGYATDRLCHKCTQHNKYEHVVASMTSEAVIAANKLRTGPKKASRALLGLKINART